MLTWERLCDMQKLQAGERLLVTDGENWQEAIVVNHGSSTNRVFLDPVTKSLISPELITHICVVKLPRQ